MRAILSNDDQDWHSHLEQSVKELGLDWQAGFFMMAGGSIAVAAVRNGFGESGQAPARRAFAADFRIRRQCFGPRVATGSDRPPATRLSVEFDSFGASIRSFIPQSVAMPFEHRRCTPAPAARLSPPRRIRRRPGFRRQRHHPAPSARGRYGRAPRPCRPRARSCCGRARRPRRPPRRTARGSGCSTGSTRSSAPGSGSAAPRRRRRASARRRPTRRGSGASRAAPGSAIRAPRDR